MDSDRNTHIDQSHRQRGRIHGFPPKIAVVHKDMLQTKWNHAEVSPDHLQRLAFVHEYEFNVRMELLGAGKGRHLPLAWRAPAKYSGSCPPYRVASPRIATKPMTADRPLWPSPSASSVSYSSSA